MNDRTGGRRAAHWALVATVAAALLGVATPSAQAASVAVDDGEVAMGSAELSPDARALHPDRDQALREYWTEERRAEATPVDLPEIAADEAGRAGPVAAGEPGRTGTTPGPGSSRGADPPPGAWGGWIGQFWPYRGDAPATTMGKVYFLDLTDGKKHSCSATVIDSEGKNLLWTAGHCVHHGAGGGWHINWVFYPHYYNGSDSTYGVWTASWLASWSKWINNSDFRYDIGAVVLNSNYSGQRIAYVTGTQGLSWNQGKGHYINSFGYPKTQYSWQPWFDGKKLMYCHGGTWSAGSDVGMNCNMVGGSSGGGWMQQFNGWNGWVNGVNSYKIAGEGGQIYSPYFGNAVGSLYNYVRYG
jgi:V8-like Glu-specific endopeptidase